MTYQEAVRYLYESAPLFQNVGQAAYKEGLENTYLLDAHFGHPHRKYKTIHVAGTNGKGSCSHTIAAVLQAAGYSVGLYTSPHLLDFRERIRVNGRKIPEARVVEFVERERAFFEPLHPSFFELTTALAFTYFAEAGVDVAVVEVGLGGRLDCTNIITPVLSVITNISLDHTQFLGSTLAQIAAEKAGIIKPGVPVVIGEEQSETMPVFRTVASRQQAPLFSAEEEARAASFEAEPTDDGRMAYRTAQYGTFYGELAGTYQVCNAKTILSAIAHVQQHFYVNRYHVAKGFAGVCELTGLMGRWQIVERQPLVVCDTGHNAGGWTYLARQLSDVPCRTRHIVFGMCEDKDVDAVLSLLPADAVYYFAPSSVRRAMPAEHLAELAIRRGLIGIPFPNVASAFEAARAVAAPDDLIYVGGSSFVVADFLKARAEGFFAAFAEE